MASHDDLLTLVEGMVLGSRILSFESKKQLLYELATFDDAKLNQLRELFDKENAEHARLSQLELSAWNSLKSELSTLVEKQLPTPTHGTAS
ncbi:hypothetical protein CO046_01550 [Candidatus Peregrinibacteria bacterium CG_4_9_14_0_2_um_filter_53_11]|nr:MAG: hypothetical protein CO046_01550 [Candidatus Peregrinibacteria bacterium CG_4_9_14_0_2_um_filter_53_11]